MVVAYEVVGEGSPNNGPAPNSSTSAALRLHGVARYRNLVPHLLLILRRHRRHAHAGLRHLRLHAAELLAMRHPAARFDAEHRQIDGIGLRRHQAVGADDAVLLAAGNDLAGQQQQRAIGVVDQHQLIDLAPECTVHRLAAADQSAQRALLGDD